MDFNKLCESMCTEELHDLVLAAQAQITLNKEEEEEVNKLTDDQKCVIKQLAKHLKDFGLESVQPTYFYSGINTEYLQAYDRMGFNIAAKVQNGTSIAALKYLYEELY